MADIGTASLYSGLTATGSTQAGAYEIRAEKSFFSTVASGAGAILDSAASYGATRTIYNGGTNELSVYPPVGSQINALGTNQPMLLAVKTACEFCHEATTLWTGILSR